MTREDYSKYYINGSDHYLIPKDIFDELFNEMNNWKKEAQKPMVQGEQGRDAKGERGTGERLETVTLTPSFPKAADLPGLQRVHGVSFPAHCGTSAHIFRSRRRSSPPGRGSLFRAIP